MYRYISKYIYIYTNERRIHLFVTISYRVSGSDNIDICKDKIKNKCIYNYGDKYTMYKEIYKLL